MAGSPRLWHREGLTGRSPGDGGRPDRAAPGRRGIGSAWSGSSRWPSLRHRGGLASGWTSAGGWPGRMHHISLRETVGPVAGAAERSRPHQTEATRQSAPRRLRSDRASVARLRYAIEAGDTIFPPLMKALLLRAVVLARRHRSLAKSTRREYRRRLERDLDAVMVLAPTNRHGLRLRKRYGLLREHLFTFLDHPEVTADNNASERDLRHTATYRKVTGGFRSDWGADLFAAVRSVIGTAARRGVNAYQAIRDTLQGHSVLAPG